MYLAGYIVTGFIVAGVYAFGWLKGRRDLYHRTALVVTLAFASLAAPVQVIVGDWAGREVANRQPIKLAAMEGLQHSRTGAPFTLGGFYDERRGEVRYGIEVPKLLSILAKHDECSHRRPGHRPVRGPPAGERGPLRLPNDGGDRHTAGDARRNLRLHLGEEAQTAKLAVVLRRGHSPGPLSFVALIAGWITTEVGRQPWIVYQLMRTEEAVTHADGLKVGYVLLVLVYTALAGALCWLLRRLGRHPPETEEASDG
jgi:cytochrome d ubiquinol oxidase subunit I